MWDARVFPGTWGTPQPRWRERMQKNTRDRAADRPPNPPQRSPPHGDVVCGVGNAVPLRMPKAARVYPRLLPRFVSFCPLPPPRRGRLSNCTPHVLRPWGTPPAPMCEARLALLSGVTEGRAKEAPRSADARFARPGERQPRVRVSKSDTAPKVQRGRRKSLTVVRPGLFQHSAPVSDGALPPRVGSASLSTVDCRPLRVCHRSALAACRRLCRCALPAFCALPSSAAVCGETC